MVDIETLSVLEPGDLMIGEADWAGWVGTSFSADMQSSRGGARGLLEFLNNRQNVKYEDI